MKQVHSCRQRGTVLVEFAIVLPLLALILLVIVDLGLVLREHQILQNAAREGARFSSLPANWVSPKNPNATTASIQQVVINYLAQENISVTADQITVNQQYPINVGTSTVYGSHVTVSYIRSLLLPAVPLLPAGQVTLTGESTFRNLY